MSQVNANPPECADFGPEPAVPTEQQIAEDLEKDDDGASIKGHWQQRLTSFQRLVFIKAFQEEKVGSILEKMQACSGSRNECGLRCGNFYEHEHLYCTKLHEM